MQKNQAIRNNATGETLSMLVSEDENGGTCQVYEVHLPPNRPSSPLHYHVDFAETFTLKSGKLDFYVGTEQRRLSLQPGDSITAQLRQPHRLANDHDETVTFTVKTKPAGGVVTAFQMAYGVAKRRRRGARQLAEESDCPASLRQDCAGLPAQHPTRLAETDFCLRGVRRKNYRHGETVAGLLFLGRVVM
jgi:mannose-6-phosphate isomerase-like protein (cupin superfamily)